MLGRVFSRLPLFRRGKVNDVYAFGEQLLLVFSDRVACFGVVLPTEIPGKGKALAVLSAYWFKVMQDIAPHHFVTADCEKFPALCQDYKETLAGRSLLVSKAIPMHVQCTVSGYLSGSLWREYRDTGCAGSSKLATGLAENSRLAKTVLAISTKSSAGERHSDNITVGEMVQRFGARRANAVVDIAQAVYLRAREMAGRRGIVIAESQFDFGFDDSGVMLIGQLLTPDSSVFWTTDADQSGVGRARFGKYLVHEYLAKQKWDTRPPVPALPKEVIVQTQASYDDALRRLTAAAN